MERPATDLVMLKKRKDILKRPKSIINYLVTSKTEQDVLIAVLWKF